MVAKYPLNWPEGYARTKSRKSAKFRSPSYRGDARGSSDLTMDNALRRLREELGRIGVKDFDGDVIISTNLKTNLAGLPRGDQGEPSDPGVAIYWEAKGQPRRVLPIDIYYRVRDNIAAAAAVLEYMRGIERHGGAMIQERAFSGFDALPPPDDCWKILTLDKDIVLKKPTHEQRRQLIMDAFRIAVRDGHGKGIDMDRVVKACDEALKLAGV